MGKLTTYLMVMTGIMILFYFGGLTDGTTSLMGILLNPTTLKTSGIIVAVGAAIITAAAAAQIKIAGTSLASAPEILVMSTAFTLLLALVWDFIVVFNKVLATNPVIAILLFSPLFLVLGITMIEWWRGVTT